MAMCTVQRLSILRELYDTAQASGAHATLGPPPNTFEMEVLDLHTRRRPGYKNTKNDTPMDPKDHWSIHPKLKQAIQTHMKSTTERFASPLDVACSSSFYWSLHARDKVFNAQSDAFSCRWTGHSHAFPNHDDPSIHKAMKWAIWSAQMTSIPTATLLVLPKRKGSSPPHRMWLKSHPSLCKHLVTIPHVPNLICREEGWIHGTPTATPPQWDLELILVSNPEARMFSLTNPEQPPIDNAIRMLADLRYACQPPRSSAEQQSLLQEMRPTASLLIGPINGGDAPTQHPATPPPSAKFQLLKAQTVHDTTVQKVTHASLRDRHPPQELLHIWRNIAYTDGSLIKSSTPGGGTMMRTGAGVYHPASGTETTVDTGSNTSSINRAELAGIWGALTQGYKTIATDSACSIAQIRKMLLQPMQVGKHMHKGMLQIIRDLINTSDQPITIMKIKAHNQHIGNEAADTVAKRATNPNTEHTLTVVESHRCREEGYWVYHKNKGTAQQELTPNQDGDTLGQPIKDLHADLVSHLHKRNRCGTSNTDSIYYKGWQAIRPTTDGAASNAFMTNPGITTAQRRSTLLLRTGTLHNQKRAKWFGMATTDTCLAPGCGQPDSGSHIAGGCQNKTMQCMYSERHNRAGRIILRAISKGSKGGDLVAADLGKAEKCIDDQAPVLDCRHVPSSLLPCPQGTAPEQHERRLRLLRPDAILVSGKGKRQSKDIRIMELKFCSDTRPEDQLHRAQKQHAELISLLLEQGYNRSNIQLIPILIGVAGTIYTQHTLDALQLLGISQPAAKKCCSKLHTQAIKSLHSIVQTRRSLERKQNHTHTHHKTAPDKPG
jgi:ribonuclease HI